MTYWYFFDQPYQGPDAEIIEGGEMRKVDVIGSVRLVYHNALAAGDTYEITEGVNEAVEGFQYQIYDDSVLEWALSREK